MLTIDRTLFVLKILTVLGCGLIAGVFFAFSTFVMKALGQRPPAEGIAAMQSINITVINPWFMSAFLGTAVICLFLSIYSLWQWQQPISVYLLLGSLFYLIGSFGVTMVCNVPLNDALAIAKPESTEGASFWASYLTDWTFWNTVRTIASLAAAALLAIASGR
ncbi:DUF1772 domain-containing protein [Pseudanabaena sp. PCC 6802]|uniref:anthrone oxygenase family protein n=1 Tax=Pseudanabaena sp. PCC 6802 TaxID=118173 RepID=UPI0003452C5C|nr:anthrone oxygenase family protein [Pseudanabaena sp. PCC 6802]